MVEIYEPSLLNGVEVALKGLKAAGVKLAIATNDRHDDTEATMRRIGVVELFNAIIGADEVENPKPSPDSILSACKRCGCLPSETIYVGDQPSDMEAGKSAEVEAVVAICPDGVAPTELADLSDFIVESIGSIEIC